MIIKRKSLDGVNEITEDTQTGITTTTLVYTHRPSINLYDGEECIASYESDKEFIEDYKKMKQEKQQLKDRINKAIEILKLCNSKCAKETIEILKGE